MSRILKASFAAFLTGALVLPIGFGQQSERWTHTALSTIFRAAWGKEIPAPEQTIQRIHPILIVSVYVQGTLTAAPIAGAAAASGQRQSASSGAFPYAIKFTSMVLRASTGSKLADDLEQVSLDHGRVYIHVRWRGLTMERHRAELRVFDGGGHKVKTSDYAFTPASPRWETWWSYYIDPDVDDPGSWRFEIDLDDETLVQKTLTVIPPARGPARSGTTTASRDAALGAYQNFIEAPRYKAFVRNDDGAWAWRIRETFYSAQLEAIQACQERSREGGQPPMCRIYAAGDDIIWNLSEKEREDVITAYKE